MPFPVHTAETAPPGAAATLAAVHRANGFIPNLYGVMAGAPSLLKGYLAVADQFAEGSLTPTEQQVIALSVSVTNGCEYCVAAHTVIAGMQRVPDDVVAAIREGRTLQNARLEALRQFTNAVVTERGHPSAATVSAFLAAGFEEAQILEVILGVGMKTMSNYVNHIAQTPLDAGFTRALWTTAQAA